MNIFSIIAGVLVTLGSLGLFLYGMKLMSESLQKIAGDKMRSILSRMTSNPFKGILTGTLITSTIQSSSATTVMVVSFVNAGLLSLTGAIGVIMGANIGTTITAWIISLLGFNISIAKIAIPLVAVAMPFLFIKQSKYKSIGEFILGFAILFIGLDLLKGSVPDIKQYPDILESIASLSSFGYASILLFVLIGSLLTVIVQSSSAMLAVTLVMCSQGWIGFEIGAAMVLGENIGTTITANLAAFMANQTAKKAARAHFIFNVIGVIWMLILFFPILHLIDTFVFRMEGFHPYMNAVMIPIGLSVFHSFFNITNSFLLVWFIPQIVKIVDKMVKTQPNSIDEFRLQYIPSRFVNTSELGIELAKKEISIFSERLIRMYEFLDNLDELDHSLFNKQLERIEKYEGITDRMEIEIASYLTKIAEGEISEKGSKQISMMLRIVDNLESIGDTIYQIAMLKQAERTQKQFFPESIKKNIEAMHQLVGKALNNMYEDLDSDYASANATLGYQYEKQINEFRNTLRDEHLEAIKNNSYSYQTGILYSGIYALYEKTGDYVINVIEALDNTQRLAFHSFDLD